MAGADEGYIPRPERKNPVFGQGKAGDPYFEDRGDAAVDTGFEQPRQLDLAEEDVRLPWLEGDDEDYEAENRGVGQGVLLALLGLVALAVIAGGVFWMLAGRSDQPLVADGGVIKAPAAPYKVRPDDPGGEVVAGTGDTSFAVAEGQARAPQIDKSDETPAPSSPAMAPAAAPKPQASATPSAAPVSGVGVQVGAYASREAAEAGWTTLKSQHEPLAGVSHRILQGKADIGTVYRLQAVPGDAAAARALCSGMKAAGLSCQVKN
ncbi:SPOR domain-containing protein [Novosphingobium soli]|uniref:SPOR domain-containing protein n=1 Tax=Novosphingobium soli TaxID=574956 RepID=A0ABV6CZ10_9SPHN